MMFLDNKYRRRYLALIDRARPRAATIGTERHHIVPRSLGGTNDHTNLVALTYREHFLAHWLLTKCTEGAARRSMNYALGCLSRRHAGHQRNLTSRQYARAKGALRDALSGRTLSLETIERMREAALNRGPEYAARMSVMKRGTKLTTEIRAKLSEIMKNIDPQKRAEMAAAGAAVRRGRKHSAETISKMGGRVVGSATRELLRVASLGNKHNLGKKRGAETSSRMSAAIKASWAKRKAEGGVRA